MIGESEIPATDKRDIIHNKVVESKCQITPRNGLLDLLKQLLTNVGVYIKNATGKTSLPLVEFQQQIRLVLRFRFTNPETFVNVRGVFRHWWHFDGPKTYRAVLFYGNVTKISPSEYHIEGYCMRLEIDL